MLTTVDLPAHGTFDNVAAYSTCVLVSDHARTQGWSQSATEAAHMQRDLRQALSRRQASCPQLKPIRSSKKTTKRGDHCRWESLPALIKPWDEALLPKPNLQQQTLVDSHSEDDDDLDKLIAAVCQEVGEELHMHPIAAAARSSRKSSLLGMKPRPPSVATPSALLAANTLRQPCRRLSQETIIASSLLSTASDHAPPLPHRRPSCDDHCLTTTTTSRLYLKMPHRRSSIVNEGKGNDDDDDDDEYLARRRPTLAISLSDQALYGLPLRRRLSTALAALPPNHDSAFNSTNNNSHDDTGDEDTLCCESTAELGSSSLMSCE